jgi:G:T/U-mismatch repair DNA glycosylase
MSVPTAIEELNLEQNKDLLKMFRTGTIGPTEEVQLFDLIYTLYEKYQKKLKLREVLKGSFDYTDFEFKRLDSEYRKYIRREEKTDSSALEPKGPEAPAIVAKSREIGTGATKALLGELQELGNILVLQYAAKASLRGESLKDYVVKSVEIREAYGDQMEAMQQENDQLKALCQMFAQAVKPQFKQLAATRMYLDWVTGLLQLQVLGIDLDKKWVDGVTARIEAAMGIQVS